MKITMLPIDTIKPYENNPRKITNSAIKKVAESIKEYGFKQPIIVDKDNIIIVGHTRFLAAKKLKIKEVPVVVADDINEVQIKAYRIADNRTNQESAWDDDLLKGEIYDLNQAAFDLTLTGFDDIEIQKMLDISPLLSEDNGKSLESKYEVVAECEDENDQEAVYKILTSKGYKCRVLSI